MKTQNQEKRFEVVIAPTDVLENELQEVLGGIARAECFTCNDKFKCDRFTIGSLLPGISSADCPFDQTLVNGWCVPNEWLLG